MNISVNNTSPFLRSSNRLEEDQVMQKLRIGLASSTNKIPKPIINEIRQYAISDSTPDEFSAATCYILMYIERKGSNFKKCQLFGKWLTNCLHERIKQENVVIRSASQLPAPPRLDISNRPKKESPKKTSATATPAVVNADHMMLAGQRIMHSIRNTVVNAPRRRMRPANVVPLRHLTNVKASSEKTSSTSVRTFVSTGHMMLADQGIMHAETITVNTPRGTQRSANITPLPDLIDGKAFAREIRATSTRVLVNTGRMMLASQGITPSVVNTPRGVEQSTDFTEPSVNKDKVFKLVRFGGIKIREFYKEDPVQITRDSP